MGRRFSKSMVGILTVFSLLLIFSVVCLVGR